MSAMFSPSRDQARQFFVDAWRGYRHARALSELEAIAVQVIGLHPEYHDVLDDPEALARDYPPEGGRTNPFLHLSLHMAIEEQLSIDQPPGIAGEYRRLAAALGDEHAAKHHILDCLGEEIWQVQHHGRAFDAGAYLDCLRRR